MAELTTAENKMLVVLLRKQIMKLSFQKLKIKLIFIIMVNILLRQNLIL